MKYAFYGITFILSAIIMALLLVGPTKTTTALSMETKQVNSVELSKDKNKAVQLRVAKGVKAPEPKKEVKRVDSFQFRTAEGALTDVKNTLVGTMSGYGPDCRGCSGGLAAGWNARNGNIYYNDATYGKIRIVAGDRSLPFGTIIRVVNSNVGVPFYAIVLDRGGDIGVGRRYMFDLLFASEADASRWGLSKNTTVEIVRYGY